MRRIVTSQPARVFTLLGCCALLLCTFSFIGVTYADPITPDVPDARGGGHSSGVEETIALNFPDNLEIKTLVEYVSDRLGVNILYDEQVVNQRITIKSPAEVPKSSLMGLLQSALKMKGYILIDADQPGWKRILPAQNLIQSAHAASQPAGSQPGDPSSAVTEVFHLSFADATKADTVVKPFLTSPGGNSLPLTEQKLLIVTDFSSNLPRIAQFIQLLDRPQKPADVRFVSVRYVEASQIAGQITSLMAAETKQHDASAASDTITVTPEPRTNRLVMIGPSVGLDQAESLARQIDVPVTIETRFYNLKSASPERIDRLARELVKPMDVAKVYQGVIDKDGNTLIVTGTPQMQQCVAQLADTLDVAIPPSQSPIRFYKLMNTTAADVLETIEAISGEGGHGPSKAARATGALSSSPAGGGNIANSLSAAGNQTSLTGSSYQSDGIQPNSATGNNFAAGVSGQSTSNGKSATDGSTAEPRTTVKTKDATITADPNTNTIIVMASPAIQSFYEEMIHSLDKRRPQVLVECTIVTLDTTNDLSLGIELGGDGKAGNATLVNFSSFGLSTPNAATGALALIPGTGFNAALLKPDVGSLIIRALADSGRSEVFSAPKILVNDNATGTLSSIAEAPYTSVNASQTVSTTSFGGYASAGTTITLTPHISEAEHLNLEYTVELNSFTGQGSNGIPPPRQTDSVTSKVTIPDGDIIVVGGLNRKNFSQTQSGIPILRLIPILKYLFSNNGQTDENTTLFVFIRPVILRDDEFRDLKYYSSREAQAAKLDPALPRSEPLLVK